MNHHFKQGFKAGLLGWPPIPPKSYTVKECIAWGDGYIDGKRDRNGNRTA